VGGTLASHGPKHCWAAVWVAPRQPARSQGSGPEPAGTSAPGLPRGEATELAGALLRFHLLQVRDQHMQVVIGQLAIGLPFHHAGIGSGKGVTHGRTAI